MAAKPERGWAFGGGEVTTNEITADRVQTGDIAKKEAGW